MLGNHNNVLNRMLQNESLAGNLLQIVSRDQLGNL